nr:uncharacterized protein LOC125988797 [Syngnathus scovelli]
MYKCYRLGRVKKMASGCFRLTTAVLLTATCLLLIAVVDSADKITTCDYGDLRVHRLYCDHGVIKVQEALYGRSSSLVCADDNPKKYLANTHCAQPNTANRIKKSCNGKKLCELSLEDFRKPDPCADTFKYLQTNFTCLPAITVVTCEGSVAHLHCDLGQVIYVYGADYGRRDRTTCSYRRAAHELENVDCTHPTDLVAKMCNGKYGCAITASNAVFGDPCITIYKYLEISYTCQYSVTPPLYKTNPLIHPLEAWLLISTLAGSRAATINWSDPHLTMYKCYRLGRVKKMAVGFVRLTTAVLLTAACLLLIAVVDSADQITTCDYGHWQVHRLYCDHGVINVQQALYGRSSSLVCANNKPQKHLANTHCAQPNTANRIKKSCNGKKLCEVNLEDFRKPDPCPDTFKYLQTNFTCLPAITVVACEGSVAHLHCGFGHVIKVYGADYGRRDRTTCSYRRAAHELENVDCTHPTDLVAKMCNGKYGCAITASNTVFGDPCITIYKYLEISYTCQYPVTHPY